MQTNSIGAALPCRTARGKRRLTTVTCDFCFPKYYPAETVMSERKGHRRRESGETAATSDSSKLCPGPINHPSSDPLCLFNTFAPQLKAACVVFDTEKSRLKPRTRQTNARTQAAHPSPPLGCQIQNNIKAMFRIPHSKVLLQPAPALGDRQTFKLQPKTWEVLGRALVSHMR